MKNSTKTKIIAIILIFLFILTTTVFGAEEELPSPEESIETVEEAVESTNVEVPKTLFQNLPKLMMIFGIGIIISIFVIIGLAVYIRNKEETIVIKLLRFLKKLLIVITVVGIAFGFPYFIGIMLIK